nr:basic proline-rich protein-like [Chlorocebus sabaeus]
MCSRPDRAGAQQHPPGPPRPRPAGFSRLGSSLAPPAGGTAAAAISGPPAPPRWVTSQERPRTASATRDLRRRRRVASALGPAPREPGSPGALPHPPLPAPPARKARVGRTGPARWRPGPSARGSLEMPCSSEKRLLWPRPFAWQRLQVCGSQVEATPYPSRPIQWEIPNQGLQRARFPKASQTTVEASAVLYILSSEWSQVTPELKHGLMKTRSP